MVKVEPFSLRVEFTAFVRPASSTDGIYPWTWWWIVPTLEMQEEEERLCRRGRDWVVLMGHGLSQSIFKHAVD